MSNRSRIKSSLRLRLKPVLTHHKNKNRTTQTDSLSTILHKKLVYRRNRYRSSSFYKGESLLFRLGRCARFSDRNSFYMKSFASMLKSNRWLSRLALTSWLLTGLLQLPGSPLPAQTAQAGDTRQSEMWLNASRAEFTGWQHHATTVSGEQIQLDSRNLLPGHDPYGAGQFQAGNYYNGGSFFYGEALAPYYSPAGGFDSAVVSWNALTPANTWVELRLRALVGNRWTTEYVMGIWSSENETIRRHSLNQSDADGRVDTDTLNLKSRATAFQLRAILFTTQPGITPSLSLAGVSLVRNGTAPFLAPQRAAWGLNLAVPERSQMIYPNGGEIWCSPTSSSMLLAYWAGKANLPGLNQPVPTAASHTFDWIYDGNGNWPFNTAWVGAVGGGNLKAYVSRLTGLSEIEKWIVQGVPVIVSIAYAPGQLTGTPIPQSNGHLLVVRGFDGAGNVITNDPAADPRLGQPIQIVYNRAQFEQRWLTTSGGAAYLIYPANQKTGDNLAHFADPAIHSIWSKADSTVGAGNSGRSWLWGPGPLTPARLETYADGPTGGRLVQYFDKSRMEVTRPAADRSASWFVTNGLLTVEMVSGQVQVGDAAFIASPPANIPVAGDPVSPDAPTYATFRSLASLEGHQTERRAPNRLNSPVTASLDRQGQIGLTANSQGVTIANYDDKLGHNLPNVFWSWMNDPARSGLTEGWLFALGYPISEPYWVRINLNGQPRTVLVQLFERRALTYTPGNPTPFQVEMGNIGQHYLSWRYGF